MDVTSTASTRRPSRAEHGQLQPPRGELLRGERVAMRACERRVDLFVGGAEERGDRVGIEGGVETRAGHGGQPTRPGGQPLSRVGLTMYCTGVYSFLLSNAAGQRLVRP